MDLTEDSAGGTKGHDGQDGPGDSVVVQQPEDASLVVSHEDQGAGSDPLELNLMGMSSIVSERSAAEMGLDLDDDEWLDDDSDSDSDEEMYGGEGMEAEEMHEARELLDRVIHTRDAEAFMLLCRDGSQFVLDTLQQEVEADAQFAGDLQMICTSEITPDGQQTPLHLVVLAESPEWVRFVLKLLTDQSAMHTTDEVSCRDFQGNTPLHYACLLGNADIAGLLLQAKADPLALNFSRKSVLHSAAERGADPVVLLLVDSELVPPAVAKQLVDTKDATGLTAFHLAAASSSSLVLRMLLDFLMVHFDGDTVEVQHYLNKEAADHKKRTALHMCAYRCDMPCSELLVGYGADLNQVDQDRMSVFHWAVSGKARQNYDSRIQRYLDWLLEEDVSIMLKDNRSRTALHYAAYYQHAGACEILTREGLSVMKGDRQGWNALHYAAATGDEALHVLLNVQQADILVTKAGSKKGMNPMHVAAKYGQEDAVMLLYSYLDPAHIRALDAADRSKRTLLYYCCLNDLLEAYTALFDLEGAAIGLTKVDVVGRNVLHAAAISNATEVFQLSMGKASEDDFNLMMQAQDTEGRTVAHLAAAAGSLNVLKWLVANDWEKLLMMRCLGGNIPLNFAAYQKQTAVLQYLLQDLPGLVDDSDMDAEQLFGHRNAAGQTVLHAATAGGSFEAVEYILTIANDVDMIDELLVSRDNNGSTPLLTAAEFGHTQLVDALQRAGAKLEDVDEEGKGAVHFAAVNGHELLMEYLLSVSSHQSDIELDFEARTKSGKTPLHLAAYGGVLVCFQVLASICSASVVDNDGNTVLHHAVAADSEMVCAHILVHQPEAVYAKNHKGRSAMDTAAFYGSVNCVGHLARVSPEEQVVFADKEGRTPLMAAAYSGHSEVVDKLLHLNASVHDRDAKKRTALHRAAGRGPYDVVEQLLRAGADCTAADENGMTPLHYGAAHGNSETMELLLNDEENADMIDAVDKAGRTALVIASGRGYYSATELLLSMEADVSLRDAKGRSALDVARARGHAEVEELLVETAEEEEGEYDSHEDVASSSFESEESDDSVEAAAADEGGDESPGTPESSPSASPGAVDEKLAKGSDDDIPLGSDEDMPLGSDEEAGSGAGDEDEEDWDKDLEMDAGFGSGPAPANDIDDGFGNELDFSKAFSVPAADSEADKEADKKAEDGNAKTADSMADDSFGDGFGDSFGEGLDFSEGDLSLPSASGEADAVGKEDDSFGDDIDFGEDDLVLPGEEKKDGLESTQEGELDVFAQVDALEKESGGPSEGKAAAEEEEEEEDAFANGFDDGFGEEEEEAVTSQVEGKATVEKEVKKEVKREEAEGKKEGAEGEVDDFGDDMDWDEDWAEDGEELKLPSVGTSEPTPYFGVSVNKTGTGRGTITLIGSPPAQESHAPQKMDSDMAAAFAQQALRQLQVSKASKKSKAPVALDGEGFDETDLALFGRVESPLPRRHQKKQSDTAAATNAVLDSVMDYNSSMASESLTHHEAGTGHQKIEAVHLPSLDEEFHTSSIKQTTMVRFFHDEQKRLLDILADYSAALDELELAMAETAKKPQTLPATVAKRLPRSPLGLLLLAAALLWLFLFVVSRIPIFVLSPTAFPS